METARVRLRIREKVSRRTFLAIWPPRGGFSICAATGDVSLDTRGNLTERNDRGEIVRFERNPICLTTG